MRPDGRPRALGGPFVAPSPSGSPAQRARRDQKQRICARITAGIGPSKMRCYARPRMPLDPKYRQLVAACDLEERLSAVPPSAKLRGLYFTNTEHVLEQNG